MSGVADAATIASMRDEAGSPATLRRLVSSGSPIDVTVIASIRDYQIHEIGGAIIQGDRWAKISDKAIIAAAWPGPPRKGDQVIQAGRKYTLVSDPNTVIKNGAVLSHKITIRGG